MGVGSNCEDKGSCDPIDFFSHTKAYEYSDTKAKILASLGPNDVKWAEAIMAGNINADVARSVGVSKTQVGTYRRRIQAVYSSLMGE